MSQPIDYALPSRRPSRAWLLFGMAACLVAVLAILAPIPSIVEVASCPRGTSMRPMGAVAMQFLGAAMGLFVAVPLALFCLIKGRHRRAGVVLGVIALVLGLIAVVGDIYVFRYIVSSRGYVLAP